MSQETPCSKKKIIRRFFQTQREKLSALQEARFERGERELKEILGKDAEMQRSFPIPGLLVGVLVWMFILLFPLVLVMSPQPGQTPIDWISILNFYVPLFGTLAVFLVNQRLVVPKLFFRKKYLSFFAANVLMLIFILWLRESYIFCVVREPGDSWSTFFSSFAFSQARNHFNFKVVLSFIIVVIFVCASCILISVFSRQIVRAFILREKKRMALQYELDFLKSQLSPHFLFNTLNNITSLISIEPKLAEQSMTKLSQLLRVMLYQTGDKYITLKEDVDILQKYAELEKLRLEENFDLTFTTELNNSKVLVEPLMLMPLVENAMKHCVNPKGNSFAHIFIKQQDNEVYVKVENSNFPRKAKNNAGGLGLSTLQKRLQLLYKDRYDYKVQVEGEVYRAELRILLDETKVNSEKLQEQRK